MIVLGGREWNVLRFVLTDAEMGQIDKTIISESYHPKRIQFDETMLESKLQARVKNLLMIKT